MLDRARLALLLGLHDKTYRLFLWLNTSLRGGGRTFAAAQELERRSRFASQGERVLALWREFAWATEGRPRPKFRLKVEDCSPRRSAWPNG